MPAEVVSNDGGHRCEAGSRVARRRHSRTHHVVVILVSLLLMGTAHAGSARTRTRWVEPGVTLVRKVLPNGPVRMTILRIDPARVSIEPVTATQDLRGYATLGQVASRRSAVAVMNGDLSALWSGGIPAHILMTDGSLMTGGTVAGASFAFDADGTRAAVTRSRAHVVVTNALGDSIRVVRWNAGATSEGMSAFTSDFGSPEWPPGPLCSARLEAETGPAGSPGRYDVTALGCGSQLVREAGPGVLLVSRRAEDAGRWSAALERGESVRLKMGVGMARATQAFGGFPLLVHEGAVQPMPRSCTHVFCGRQPRTAVGLTKGCTDVALGTPCRVLLVVVDGRRPGWSVGSSLRSFASAMERIGAYEALNLDGGASSQLFLGRRSISRPAPGASRAVVSAIVVRRRMEPAVLTAGAIAGQEGRGPRCAEHRSWP